VAPDTGNIFVVDNRNHRIQYFTPRGRFLGKWGSLGEGNGQFNRPTGVALKNTGARVYIADYYNSRVQHFKREAPAVEPASLGRVKALFK